MRVGLGTGRAATAGIQALGRRVAREGLRVVGVPTSPLSDKAARIAGIPIGRPGEHLDLAFDGADAVDPSGRCVKGAGGAMVRERVLAQAAERFIVLVDRPKLVTTLDEWGVLPIAVVPFAAGTVEIALADLAPARRPSRSDDGLVLLDLSIPTGSNWDTIAARARALPGVVDHGLFHLVMADVIVGHPDGTATAAG